MVNSTLAILKREYLAHSLYIRLLPINQPNFSNSIVAKHTQCMTSPPGVWTKSKRRRPAAHALISRVAEQAALKQNPSGARLAVEGLHIWVGGLHTNRGRDEMGR